jgi:DNA-binding NarL/FixJ family response regulator
MRAGNGAGGGSRGAPRLLLADDHRMLRQGLRHSLQEMGCEVVGEAGDGHETVELARQLRPDVVLMDVSMPVLDGVEATRVVRRELPATQVVMLTMHSDAELVARALQAGAAGYLTKDCSIEEVVEAVRMAASEWATLSPNLASSMLAEVVRYDRARKGEEAIISPREEEVLQLVADGLSLPEVAEKLFISQKTVKNHLASIYQKLDARDRTQAVLRAVRMGIIRLD